MLYIVTKLINPLPHLFQLAGEKGTDEGFNYIKRTIAFLVILQNPSFELFIKLIFPIALVRFHKRKWRIVNHALDSIIITASAWDFFALVSGGHCIILNM